MAAEQFWCTVVVPTFNRSFLLKQTLLHLAAQTLPRASFEVIVVDDGSSDGSEMIVRAFAGDLHVRYLWQEDQGFRVAAARNLGISVARAPLTVFIDSGVLPHPTCLECHLASHRNNCHSALVGYVHGFDAGLIKSLAGPAAQLDPCLSDSLVGTDAREAIYRSCDDDLSSLPAPWTVFWTCNVAVPTAMLQCVGGFDERFSSWGGEDIELAYRLLQAGLTLKLVRSAKATHLPHEFSGEEQRRSSLRNYRYFARKHKISIERAIMGSVWRSTFAAEEVELSKMD